MPDMFIRPESNQLFLMDSDDAKMIKLLKYKYNPYIILRQKYITL